MPVPPWKERSERLAINVADLTLVDPFLRQNVLVDKLDLTEPIRVSADRVDEAAVAFRCDLLTAAAACDVVRSEDRRAGIAPTRVYVKRREAWQRLPATAVLTEIVDGRCVLHRSTFGADPALLPPPAKPAIEKVEW